MNKKLTEPQKYFYNLIQERYPDDTPFKAADLEVDGKKASGKTLASLAARGFLIKVNDKSPYIYVNAHKEYIETEISNNKKQSQSSSNAKEDNQWIGKYFELCCVAQINNTGVIPDPTQYKSTQGYNFTEEEKQKLYNQARKVADYIGSNHHAEWIGEHTISATGDILLDGIEHIEIKHVSSGTGTYFNPGFSYCQKYGFSSEEYLKRFQLRETIERLFPNQVVVRYDILNPFANKDDYKKIDIENPELINVDTEMRKAICKDLVNYFKSHPNEAHVFFRDMLNKYGAREYKGKKVPEGHADRYIVYNYKTKEIIEKNVNDYKNHALDNIDLTGKGFKIGGLRIQVSWKNRIGNTLALYVSFTNHDEE